MTRCSQLLHSVGQRYTETAIRQSELRLLQTVYYRVDVDTPLLYLETLVKILRSFLLYCLSTYLDTYRNLDTVISLLHFGLFLTFYRHAV